MKKEPYNISFSGGRTSAYMTKLLIDNFRDRYDFIVTFANTSREDPRTLEFVRNCDQVFGFNTVWLEAVVHHGERKSSTHRIVTYETAARNGEVFEDFIRKYGIPNKAFLGCTREMKLNAIDSYLRSIGHIPNETKTAIGIRADEQRRVSKEAGLRSIEYPLVDLWPCDKQDVLTWWEDQPFDLGIEEFEGNCIGCFKKSDRKHFLQIDKDPGAYDWCRRMESLYRRVGPQEGERVFFRGNRSTDQLFEDYELHKGSPRRMIRIEEENGGCSESCEFLPTESV